MNNHLFYSSGLHFSCTRCSNCCRHESGYVYLSENDLFQLANFLKMDYNSFIGTWCRWVPFEQYRERLSLKEQSNFDCIFWNAGKGMGGCTVYDARPLQCRAFPFWDYILCSEEAWKNAGKDCPGINNGELKNKEGIENLLKQIEKEPVIEREIRRIGVR